MGLLAGRAARRGRGSGCCWGVDGCGGAGAVVDAEGDVLSYGAGEEGGFLLYEGDDAAVEPRVEPADGVAAEADAAGAWVVKAFEQSDDSRLAAA